MQVPNGREKDEVRDGARPDIRAVLGRARRDLPVASAPSSSGDDRGGAQRSDAIVWKPELIK